MTRIILFNKPCGVLTQFTSDDAKPTLADYIDQPGYYAAGRLDANSEGLMILTDNGRLQSQISHPKHKMKKTYWAQVEGVPSEAAIAQLCGGIVLRDGPTRPAEVTLIAAPAIWPRTPPIRYRAEIPTQWLRIVISEGRNRQIRRMTAHVGHPTLRLIRVQIGPWHLGQLQPGEWRFVDLDA